LSHPLEAVRAFLLDMDGTFCLGERILPGSLEFIATLRRQGKDFLFLTNNSSQDARFYAEKLTRMGLPVGLEKVFTSGEAAARYLQRVSPGARLFVMGTPSLRAELRWAGLRPVRKRPDWVVLGFDKTLTYDRLRGACDHLRAGVPLLATHPDIKMCRCGCLFPQRAEHMMARSRQMAWAMLAAALSAASATRTPYPSGMVSQRHKCRW
jgi:HAD superfamily hydrolase (TIGR01450 family)